MFRLQFDVNRADFYEGHTITPRGGLVKGVRHLLHLRRQGLAVSRLRVIRDVDYARLGLVCSVAGAVLSVTAILLAVL